MAAIPMLLNLSFFYVYMNIISYLKINLSSSGTWCWIKFINVDLKKNISVKQIETNWVLIKSSQHDTVVVKYVCTVESWIWKNNKRDPSFTREMRVSTSNKNLIRPVVLAVLICGGKKGKKLRKKRRTLKDSFLTFPAGF